MLLGNHGLPQVSEDFFTDEFQEVVDKFVAEKKPLFEGLTEEDIEAEEQKLE